MSLFLTAPELVDLTGRRQPAAQRRWLVDNGYAFDVRADGTNAVLREAVLERQEDGPLYPPLPPAPDGILRADEIMALPDGSGAANRPGIYFLLLAGDVVYVGMSRQVADRLYAHECESLFRRGVKRWDAVRVLHCDGPGLCEAEGRHIRHYQPRYNIKGLR